MLRVSVAVKPTNPLVGKSLDEMKQAYEAGRDKKFATLGSTPP